jgi:hypothetical protein
VTLSDKREFDAKLIGTDKGLELMLLPKNNPETVEMNS